jgi:hypothetical protein
MGIGALAVIGIGGMAMGVTFADAIRRFGASEGSETLRGVRERCHQRRLSGHQRTFRSTKIYAARSPSTLDNR